MNALVVQEPGVVELVDMDDPIPQPGYARVHVRVAAICMTDLELIEGGLGIAYPLTPGHEWSGVVNAVGSDSDRPWIGCRVTGDNELTCLECVFCRRGEWRRCPQYRQLGFQAPGTYAQYVLVPVRNLHALDDAISFEQGALLEPLGVGLAVAAMSECRAGSMAAVLGAGPIGLNCVSALKASGATRILCLDSQKQRLEWARSWGAAATFDEFAPLVDAIRRLHPEGTDIVVDATGNAQAIASGISLARFGGTIVLAGYCSGRAMEMVPDVVHLKNARILGAGNNCGFTSMALRCVADGMIRTEQMITHRYRIEDYRRALSRETVSQPGYMKGVFTFD